MTPAQVYATLQDLEQTELLKKTKHLIIGGGAINLSLQKLLENFPYNVWSTYGMTETLSHIALRKIMGDQGSNSYIPFENVNIALSENKTLMINAHLCVMMF